MVKDVLNKMYELQQELARTQELVTKLQDENRRLESELKEAKRCE